MGGCSFRFAFKSGVNLPAKVLAYTNEKLYTSAVNCLTLDAIWFDLMKIGNREHKIDPCNAS